MSELTPNLGLFKYNTETDGKETFSIQAALNNNWDILDNVMTSTASLGESGYVRFNSGLIINYGVVPTTSGEVTWTQPVISQNGSMGGNSFAVSAYKERYSASGLAYNAFDNNDSTYAFLTAGDNWVQWYNPTPIKVTNIYLYAGAQITNVTIQASNDVTSWTSIPCTSTTITTGNLTLTNSNFYKYYRLNYHRAGSASLYLYTIRITATYVTTASNNIIFPCAFHGTTYAYSLAFYNGIWGDSYATNMTSTGLQLQNNTNAEAVYYVAIGY